MRGGGGGGGGDRGVRVEEYKSVQIQTVKKETRGEEKRREGRLVRLRVDWQLEP